MPRKQPYQALAGIDPKAPMEKYAASVDDLRKAELARMTPEQRDQRVEEAGRQRWKKANPKVAPMNWYLIGLGASLSMIRAGCGRAGPPEKP